MSVVTALEAETKFGELLDRVMNGEEILITSHDRPVARVVPARRNQLEEARRAAQGFVNFSESSPMHLLGHRP
jgi:prevent-host-death family protein